VLAASHEHNYQRALLTTGDAVLVCIVSGGAGSPLHQIATGPEAQRIFSLYQVPGAVFKPENVVTAVVFNYVHMRLWYGGGEFFTYAVDGSGKDQLIDHVQIDLKRFGTPEIVRWGMTPAHMGALGSLIAGALSGPGAAERLGPEVTQFRRKFNTLRFMR